MSHRKPSPALYLFDDGPARSWEPFALTRPVGELRYGTWTLRGRAERTLGIPCSAYVTGPGLLGFDEPGAPPCVSADAVGNDLPRIFLASRAVLEAPPRPTEGKATRYTLKGRCAGWFLPAGAPTPPDRTFSEPDAAGGNTSADVELSGTWLDGPWDLVAGNPDRLRADIPELGGGDSRPGGVHLIGDHPLVVEPGATVEPGVVVDTREGPVHLCEGVRVEGPARLGGPLWVGPKTLIFGGSVGGSTIGAVCKIRGEVAECVILDFVNKAHDGHLGHALLGRWVNLGAGTTNSDLKNNYGTVRVWTPDGDVDTGATKIGCFLGDHVKTGIGTLLNTGTVVGAGSNLFGGSMPPNVVPPFSWGSGSDLTEYRLDKFFEVAEVAMGRRSQELTPGVRSVLERAFADTGPRRT